ncbi:MAG: hypothetical protein DWP98_13385 [Bacteroidetes bacterium]|nr:MAG: hypothetical protein DWP98_13385 [Bacteroidota bacterium]MBL1143556.1 hypothetical protein [Bacteroidota bacterium]NOG56358.1 hypothetical protein [Bacteroidota bacterium]
MRITITILFLQFFLNAKAQSKEYISFISDWESTYSKLPEFNGFDLYVDANFFGIIGDFFGDNINDHVFYIIDSTNKVKLALIDKGIKQKVYILGLHDDPFDIDDYKWAEIIKKVNRGEVLWSNFTDDFRKLSEVPESEKIYLNYDALYLHAAESCGRGFVYWKSGKFHWLQQE